MWPNPYGTAHCVTLAEEILNGKNHFWFSGCKVEWKILLDFAVSQQIIKAS